MKNFFNEQELKRISDAITKAEKRTSGEIAVAFIKQSDSYAIYELFAALIVGLIYLNIMLINYQPVNEFISSKYWVFSHQITAAFIGLSSFIVVAIVYLLMNIPFVDRLIVPKKIMKKKAEDRAYLHFIKAGLTETRDRTGILIFISYLERRVIIIGDMGINKKIKQEKWGEFIEIIIAGIKNNRLADSLVSVIKQCGHILEEHFPIKPDDTNELSNDVTFLER